MINSFASTSYTAWLRARIRERLAFELADKIDSVRLEWHPFSDSYGIMLTRRGSKEVYRFDTRFQGKEQLLIKLFPPDEIARLILFLQ